MLVGSRQFIWTLLLLFAEDVFSNKCFVDYPQKLICAVRGSSVVFFCLFNFIEKEEVSSLMWGRVRAPNVRLILSYPGNVSQRFEYTGDKKGNCSMKIHKVEHYDAGKYIFRYNANKGCRSKRLLLEIVDLNILLQNAAGEVIKEGDSVSLTCINGCGGDDASSVYTWFKDGGAINEGPVLHLTNVSSEHSGNYTCSLKSQKGTASGAIYVDVQYGPKSTSVLFRSSSEADADGSIVLICCSDARPPIQNYSWFEIADGQILKVGHQAEMLPLHGGQYLCSVSNKHGSQNSTVFTLKMNAYWTTFLRDLLVIVTVAVLLVVTSVIAAYRLSKSRRSRLETEHVEEIQRIDGVNRLRREDSHQPQAIKDRRDEETTAEVIYATIDFHERRKSNMKQQNYQHDTVIYSTVCRN